MVRVESDSETKRREEDGVDKVGFHITVVKWNNSKGTLKQGRQELIYLSLILRSISEYTYSHRGLPSGTKRERERENSCPLLSKAHIPASKGKCLVFKIDSCSQRLGPTPNNQEIWVQSQLAFWHAAWLWANHFTSLPSDREKVSAPCPCQRNLFRLKLKKLKMPLLGCYY